MVIIKLKVLVNGEVVRNRIKKELPDQYENHKTGLFCVNGKKGKEPKCHKFGTLCSRISGVECGTACCPWQENLWK